MPAASPTLFFFAASAASLMLAFLSGDDPVGPVVRTQQGLVRGAFDTSHGGRKFLGFQNLPYAKPPVGQLRFRSPQPPDPWVDIRDATARGPVCPQNNKLGPNEREDCLYLNVFTPELKPAELFPVMFWIHGGGWVSGTGAGYKAGYLIDNNVVLVTINYRLGPLGFLSTDDENCPGNFGLKDQVAALKWVKENIEAFGGNPNDVTIFGNSAGAASVHYHMLSTASKGLFNKAISESGVALATWARPEPGLDNARKIAALVGCPSEPSTALVECLRGVDEPILTAAALNLTEWFFCPMAQFRPVVEKKSEDSFLSDNPLNLKPHSAIPWLVGVNSEEGAVFTGAFVEYNTMLEDLDRNSDKLFPVCFAYQTSPRAKLITERIRDFYFSSNPLTVSGSTDMISDGIFTWKTDESIRRYNDTQAIYYYLFSYRGKYSMSDIYAIGDVNIGVAHGDEAFYLFSNNPYMPITGDLPAKDIEMAKTLTKLWTDFAKTGNPTPDDDPLHWPQVTFGRELQYLRIGEKLEVKKGLFQKRIDFWKSLPF
ncbi:juvenile hormone esterase-like [Schistocerca piceifrons]|uniref:juvenile hormone esterase-like n=1 Tax=Schistocerca piceifrons TaxID=274613 RepID=UPI001F5F08D3|nr:juvenile hormone esterase-like [Schistocerca piceifrons]